MRNGYSPQPCCERDRDRDGNCDRHPRPPPPTVPTCLPPSIAATQHQNIKHLTEVRATLPSLPPEQRLWLFAALAKGYCTACGEAITGTCHCENDE